MRWPRDRRTTGRVPALALVLLLTLLVGSLAACGDGDGAEGEETAQERCEPVETPVESRPSNHVLDPAAAEFDHHPPASGPHVHDPPAAGVHDEPLPEAEQVVALELGSVVVNYDPEAVPRDTVEALEALAGERDRLIVTPAPVAIDDGRPIALTAWMHRRLCRSDDRSVLDTVEAFLDEYAGEGVGEVDGEGQGGHEEG